ncbi:Cytochrome c' [Candidatus Rhodobacter oscarellae]|uniref:Cytochrome c n=1 Tax=Candidatus Rhodobacter oscarellae TaxID=1675527 RepID=A0A0J9E3T0_9RHOB|nr:cytochrome c [Candidatus Rhodobacter lobularis]KMW57372.1 Cytochrome c' [Candidatus Rhodobacter lobularis]
MLRTSHLMGSFAALAIAATTAFAGGHAGNPAVKARKSHMQLYGFHLGILGGMAKGDTEYNAAAAQTAADNLAALATMNTMAFWVPGTSVDELGDETRALAKMWAADSTVIDKAMALGAAATAMQAAAGSLEGVQGAIGAVGGACGSCHKAYRGPSN